MDTSTTRLKDTLGRIEELTRVVTVSAREKESQQALRALQEEMKLAHVILGKWGDDEPW